ncbi:MAG TPA: hypothetical protein VIJ46_04410, partial [Rhabdochlamydiaceae bacterium]
MVPYPGCPEITVACSSSILLDAPSVMHRIGLDAERLRLVMDAADRGGYFDDKPRLARSSISDEEIRKAVAHLGEFNGQGNWIVTFQSAKAFLEQFPPRFRPSILQLIRSMTILDRAGMASAISKVIQELPQPKDGHRGFIVGLSPDSGN